MLHYHMYEMCHYLGTEQHATPLWQEPPAESLPSDIFTRIWEQRATSLRREPPPESLFCYTCIGDHEWRQAVTATGSRCIAALSVKRYLVGNDLLVEFHQLQTEEVKKGLTDRDA
ncbi:hypothetical protein REPUB_Repub04eG0193600 [Reevesia pubescens]